jgi:hypothetical protein
MPQPPESRVLSTGLVHRKYRTHSPMKFRFHQVSETRTPVPPPIEKKGARWVRYAKALIRLSEAGNKDAKFALRVLRDKGSRTRRRKDKRSDLCTPVDLDSATRWQLDEAGIFALELLLRVWRVRHRPKAPHTFDAAASRLPEFTKDTARQWWRVAFRHLLSDVYRSMDDCPELLALVGTPRKLKSGDSWRHGIVRVIRTRFCSFAPKQL